MKFFTVIFQVIFFKLEDVFLFKNILKATVIFLAITQVTYASQSVPRYFNFQGFITDSSNTPINGTKRMRMGLYNDNIRIWYAEYSSVSVSAGFFSALLGDQSSGAIALSPINGSTLPIAALPVFSNILDVVTATSVVQLELEVYNGSSFELFPQRFDIASALFALKADKIDGYDSDQLAKIDGSGNVLSSGNVAVISPTGTYRDWETDRNSTRLNSSHSAKSRMPSSA